MKKSIVLSFIILLITVGWLASGQFGKVNANDEKITENTANINQEVQLENKKEDLALIKVNGLPVDIKVITLGHNKEIKVGDDVEMIGMGETKKTTVTGVEMFRKLLDEGRAGDNAGLLLRGVNKEDLNRGMVLAAPGSITPHTKFKASVYVLKKDEGGRHTPFFNGYRPQFYFRTTDVTGVATLPSGTEMVMPGDNVELEVELIMPIAMDKELRFAIREGGHTVGAGVVTDIVE